MAQKVVKIWEEIISPPVNFNKRKGTHECIQHDQVWHFNCELEFLPD